MATQRSARAIDRIDTGEVFLRDGTPLDSLIDRKLRRVALRACADEEIYQLEMKNIFGKAWMCLAHETEIPNAGDFVTRNLGSDSVIVVRAAHGGVEVLLNVCSHRALQILRSDAGNTKLFLCPYHGWSFDHQGCLKGVPRQSLRYDQDFDKSARGLRRARAGVSHGFVFATWDQDALPLEQYVGNGGWSMDMILKRTDAGMVALGPPQRWIVKANWKLGMEQLAGDGYHNATTHASLPKIGFGSGTTKDQAELLAKGADEFGFPGFPCGISRELMHQLPNNLTTSQLDYLKNQYPLPVTTGMFPNFVVIISPFPNRDGTPGHLITPRVLNPISATETEILVWLVAEKDASQEVKDVTRLTSTYSFGPGGVYDQDDTEMWTSMQRAAQGLMGGQQWLDYSAGTGSAGREGARPFHDKSEASQYGFDTTYETFWLPWLEAVRGETKPNMGLWPIEEAEADLEWQRARGFAPAGG